MKSPVVIILLMVASFGLLAQSSIHGQLLDKDQNPLAFANILLLSPTDSSLVVGTVSDEAGQYELRIASPGDYLLAYSMLGYQSRYRAVSLINDPAVAEQPTMTLLEDTEVLDEVVVTAKRPPFEHQIDRLIVNVQNSITSTGSNALEVLTRSPGVRVDGISNQIMLDGNAGVIIQINGKRSRMDGDALLQLLQSMPANNIEKIELIHTPPASYDAEGTAGIINIVLVKNLEEGSNGSFTLNSGYGERPKFGGAIDFNLRKGKWNVFADASSNNNYLQEDVSIVKSIRDGDIIRATDSYSNRPAFRGFYGGKIGVDFSPGSKTTLGIILSGYQSVWDLDADTETTVWVDGELNEQSRLRSLEENDWKHWMVNLNLQHEFSNGWMMVVDYDYLDYFNTNPADYLDALQDGQGNVLTENNFISRKKNPIQFQVAKLDFSRPIGEKGKLETGLKMSISDLINDNRVADIIDGQEVLRPTYTNRIVMDENVYAAYVSTNWQLSKKTSAKAGVRYEYTDLQLNDENGLLSVRQYGRLFPSVFLSHNINDDNSVQFSYSERIQRPSLNALAPAFFFFSPNTLITGNPTIRAAITRQVRASYRHKGAMLNVQWGQDDRPMFWGQLDIVPEENLTVSSPSNMSSAQRAFLWLSFPVKITEWWESRFEGGLAWQRLQPIFEGEVITQESVFNGFNSVQSFNLGKEITVELDGYLQSGMDYGLKSIPMQGGFNVGFRKKFEDESSLSLSWYDAFNLGTFWTNNYNRPELNLVHEQIYQQEGSIFRLSYSRSFGNKQIKRRDRRSGASSDEQSRVQ